MTEIVLIYILTGITAAALILLILLLIKYSNVQKALADLKSEQMRSGAAQTENMRHLEQDMLQSMQLMQNLMYKVG